MASSHTVGYTGGFVKARKYDLAATNIANMGTDFEKAIKEAAADGEKAVCSSSTSTDCYCSEYYPIPIPILFLCPCPCPQPQP